VCELICREIETYSNNAIRKASRIITDSVTPLSNRYETSSGPAPSLLVQQGKANGLQILSEPLVARKPRRKTHL
jgi:hypothetical protein